MCHRRLSIDSAMRPSLFALAVCAAAAATPAGAVTCYLLVDRNDNVVYRDVFPPVDLSESGDAERKALRARNEHMVAMEVEKCPRLEFITGAGTGTRINLEDMGDLPAGITVKPGSEKSTVAPAKRSATPAAKPAPAKAAPAHN